MTPAVVRCCLQSPAIGGFAEEEERGTTFSFRETPSHESWRRWFVVANCFAIAGGVYDACWCLPLSAEHRRRRNRKIRVFWFCRRGEREDGWSAAIVLFFVFNSGIFTRVFKASVVGSIQDLISVFLRHVSPLQHVSFLRQPRNVAAAAVLAPAAANLCYYCCCCLCLRQLLLLLLLSSRQSCRVYFTLFSLSPRALLFLLLSLSRQCCQHCRCYHCQRNINPLAVIFSLFL